MHHSSCDYQWCSKWGALHSPPFIVFDFLVNMAPLLNYLKGVLVVMRDVCNIHSSFDIIYHNNKDFILLRRPILLKNPLIYLEICLIIMIWWNPSFVCFQLCGILECIGDVTLFHPTTNDLMSPPQSHIDMKIWLLNEVLRSFSFQAPSWQSPCILFLHWWKPHILDFSTTISDSHGLMNTITTLEIHFLSYKA